MTNSTEEKQTDCKADELCKDCLVIPGKYQVRQGQKFGEIKCGLVTRMNKTKIKVWWNPTKIIMKRRTSERNNEQN